MTDPTFTSRAELEAWAERRRMGCWVGQTLVQQLNALDDIRRVTLAHAHLLEEPK